MAKTDIPLHIPHGTPAAPIRVRSDTAVRVPRYALYGDSTTREWFVNVEPLERRAAALEWRIEPHTHPKFTQLLFVTQGDGEMTLDGDALPFASPCVLVIPPFRIHSFLYRGLASGKVVTVENNYLGDLLGRGPDLRPVLETAGAFPLSASAKAGLTAPLAMLEQELVASSRGSAIAAEIHLLQMLLTILRDRPAADAALLCARGRLVDRLIDLVETRYRTQPDIDQLAGELGVSAAQLRHACKDATGLSPLALLHDRIAAEAKRCLIYSSASVAEIGYSLGFDDAAYFTRFFKRMAGVTPTTFRGGH